MSPARSSSGTTKWVGSFTKYLAAIVENSDDAIVSKDLEGKILSWNEAATRMYGYASDEAIGQPIDIVIPDDPERRREELDIRAKIAQGERIDHYETVRRRKDGTSLPVSLSISPVRDASGQIVAAAGFARDISEQRMYQEAQRLAAKSDDSEQRRATGLVTGFAEFSAHDFKTPMQHILWDAQSALESLSADDLTRVKALLERIIAKSRWMQSRTDGLRVASGLSQGKSPPREHVSSQKAFDEAYRTLAEIDQLVGRAEVTCGPLPNVTSNVELLGFLFQNLIQNACKYGRVDVPVIVHVSAERIGGAWQFSVKDNGRGVSRDKLTAIFEPYVRGENVGFDEPGSGIGLHLCRTIVEGWHQGRIWVESGGPEPGSIFKFSIPDLRVGNGK
jgi:PAS domain S-box-containing protein